MNERSQAENEELPVNFLEITLPACGRGRDTKNFFSHSGAYQVDYRNLFLKFFHSLYFLVNIADVTEAWSNHKPK